MTIFVFGEGDSEKNVCQELEKRFGFQLEYKSAKGNGKNVNKIASDIIRPLLQEEEPISCVIMYDLDSHENKIKDDILKGVFGETGWLKKIKVFNEIDFLPVKQKHLIYENLYTLSLPEFKFNLAVHIATKRWKENFEKSAIDDYVLELALLPTTVTNILAAINKEKTKINIPSSKILEKVTQEIPDLLQSNANGIDDLIEAKDYVRLYAVVLKLHTSPAVVTAKVMANANEQDIRNVFGALIAAFEFLGGA